MVTERVCTDCGAIFENEDALVSHRSEKRHGDPPFKCDECAEEFRAQQDLAAHLTDRHGAESEAPIR
jgi:uncharacterized C2H2 Zn-finger protein